MQNSKFKIERQQPGSGFQPNFELREAARRRGFTLIELLVAVSILLVLGLMIMGFLRGAIAMSRTGQARGQQYETGQVVLRTAVEDFSQITPLSPRRDGDSSAVAFVVTKDCFGRQVICFTRAFGEELSTLAGYDSGRASASRGYNRNFTGRNVKDQLAPTGGNLEVVYILDPSFSFGTRLYRAIESPARQGGLIDSVLQWVREHPNAADDDWSPAQTGFMRNYESRFELVADNVLAFNVECWDEDTQSWDAGPTGPKTEWRSGQRDGSPGQPVIPYAVRLTVIVGAADPIAAESPLMAPIGANDSFITVDSTANFGDAATPGAYLRIGGELIAYGDKGDSGFGSCARGALGTRASPHAAGFKVRGGEMFRRVIQIPGSK
jgi:prepilin-type N-terminal cleavage/methylation domain-containing protein